MTLPNFLVIGAGRSGTTSLHHYLAQHPDVFVPAVKSPSYFYAIDEGSADGDRLATTRSYFVRTLSQYEALFDPWTGERGVGEVSPAYLSSTRVAARIGELLGDVRRIAILRNPVERVHARFVARRRDGAEPASDVLEAIDRERRGPLDLDDTAGTYFAAGFVSHVLGTHMDAAGRDRVRCYLFEDLVLDPKAVVRDMFEFLDVDPEVEIDVSEVHNRSGGTIANPLGRALWTGSYRVRTWLRPHVPRSVRDRAFRVVTRTLLSMPLDPGVRRELVGLYRDEILALGQLVDRDLGHWCSEPPPCHPS